MLPIKTTHRARLANAATDGWGRINSGEETDAGKTRRAGLTAVGGAKGGAPSRTYDESLYTTTAEREHHEQRKHHSCAYWTLHQCDNFRSGERAAAELANSEVSNPTVTTHGGWRRISIRRPSRQSCSGCDKTALGSILRSSHTNNLVRRALALNISHPRRYIMCSWLRLVRLGWGQFWPIFVPIVRAHIDTGHLAFAECLDSLTVLSGDGFFTTAHL